MFYYQKAKPTAFIKPCISSSHYNNFEEASCQGDNLVDGKMMIYQKWALPCLNNLPLNTPGWGLIRTTGRLHGTTGSGRR